MLNRKVISLFTLCCVIGIPVVTVTAQDGPKLESLLKAELGGVIGTEVIVSRVTIPPNSSLPKHWHPGEEFAYVLSGSVILWQEGKPDKTYVTGEAVKIPRKQVHTAKTQEDEVLLLVFRVHEQGEPERVLVE
jgi:quercetin dioxygenase-like cupin family protein